MGKRFIFGLLLFFSGSVLLAKQVSIETAQRVAACFFSERIQAKGQGDASTVRITETSLCEKEGVAVYYIFNMSPAGYVVVSADDAVIPILAYSLTENYSASDAPPQFTAWIKQYSDQIAWAISQKTDATPPVARIWQYYRSDLTSLLTPHSSPLTINSNEVAPLITSNWNQNAPYNSACPADATGPGGHTYAGCVPVCMGQLMNYYRWPETGTGSYTYSDPPYGTLSADFGNTTYNWDEMTNTIATASNPEIAKLLFHLGISCDLQYGPAGSGMYNHKAAYSLRTYFKFSPQTRYVFRDSTSMNWDSILVAHLNRKMPMYYAGWSVPNINGHAFVCDGYQYDSAVQQYYFHFNFGWSGSNNGYFFTNNLIVGGNNFNLAQEVIINAYPDTINYTYPKYCEGSKSLTALAGSFGDGSGPMKNYSPAADCSWLINPQTPEDSVSTISLNIGKFSTSPTDFMTVYDGPTKQSPVLWRHAGGDTTPVVISTGNKMLVTFKANGGPTSSGWLCNYSTSVPVFCTGINTITADTAVINDGSAPFNYHNNTNCRWKLLSENGNPLTIHFRRFDTEPGKDILKIYDFTTGDTLASLSGHYDGSLPDSVTAPGGKMFLSFTTNSSVTGKGWEIYYPMSHVGIPENGSLQALNIYPNPASGHIRAGFTLNTNARVTFHLTSVTGTTVYETVSNLQLGSHLRDIDISAVSPGIYILQVKTNDTVINNKIIIK